MPGRVRRGVLLLVINKMLAWIERAALAVLSQAPRLPRHIALIMDGNRRFGRARGISAEHSHRAGIQSLRKAIRFSQGLGIREMTVFAFAIENYRRPQEEVEALLRLVEETLDNLESVVDSRDRATTRIRVVGCLAHPTLQARPSLLQKIERVQQETAANSGFQLNICFSYNSTWETAQALEQLRGAGLPLSRAALLAHMPLGVPDLIVRTSGERRLSNFLALQSEGVQAQFLPELWPEVGLWTYAKIILNFNRP